MKWHTCCVTGLTMLLLTSAAWAQSVNSTSADTSTAAGTTTDTSGQDASDLRQNVVQGIRSSLAQVFADMIHNFFTNLRTLIGLPASATDPTTDPLAILESTVDKVVNEKLASDSAGQ